MPKARVKAAEKASAVMRSQVPLTVGSGTVVIGPEPVVGAAAPDPITKTVKTRKGEKASGVAEGRLLGAVADFWERKQARARSSTS